MSFRQSITATAPDRVQGRFLPSAKVYAHVSRHEQDSRIRWGDGVILICELSCAKASCIAAWEKEERWRHLGESSRRGAYPKWLRFGSQPVPGSREGATCSAFPIRRPVIS